MTTLYGPDTSNNNFTDNAVCLAFLNRLIGEGFSFIIQKVSEGNYYKDPFWSVVNQWAAENNFPCIGYHYVTTNDAASQARTWLANGGGKFAMLDFEANSGDIDNFWAVVNAFNAAGVTIDLSYLPHWYWQQIGSPDLSKVPGLVASSYVNGTGYASALYPGAGAGGWQPYGGDKPGILQFTDKALIGGLSVDCNAFEGSVDQLTALLGGTTVTAPTPAPAPVGATLPDIATVVEDNQEQLRGPNLNGWPQLDGYTLVDALAAIGQHLGITGFNPPAK